MDHIHIEKVIYIQQNKLCQVQYVISLIIKDIYMKNH